MCKHGDIKKIWVKNNPNGKWYLADIDRCLVNKIQNMIHNGIITQSSCCGHGKWEGYIWCHGGDLYEYDTDGKLITVYQGVDGDSRYWTYHAMRGRWWSEYPSHKGKPFNGKSYSPSAIFIPLLIGLFRADPSISRRDFLRLRT